MGLYKRKGSDKYWIKLYQPGQRTKPQRIATGTSDHDEAKRIYEKYLGDRADGLPIVPKTHTIQFWQLAEDVMLDYENKELKTIQHAEGRLRNHVVPFFGQMTASYITTREIALYQQKRRKQGAKPATVRHELELVSKAFTLAKKAYRLIGPEIELPTVNNAKAGFFEEAEFEKVMDAIDVQYGPFLLFSYITGWRSGEIKNLRRRHVDFPNRCVRLDPGTKNGDPRVFPFTDKLEALLRTVIPAHGFADDYVFTYRPRLAKDKVTGAWSYGPPRPIGDFGKAFATACYKAGLPCKTETWSYVEPKSGKTFSGVRVLHGSHTPHDFRRTAVRNLTNMGVPEKVAMQMCGHRTRAVFDRYRIVAQTDLDIAAAKMNEAHKNLKGLDASKPAGTVAGTVSRFGKAK